MTNLMRRGPFPQVRRNPLVLRGRAGDATRTRDIFLGKEGCCLGVVTLSLSHFLMKPEPESKEQKLWALLKAREIKTIDVLAKVVGCGRGSLNLVLLGERTGIPTWEKLAKKMTVEEFALASEAARERLLERGKLIEREGKLFIPSDTEGEEPVPTDWPRKRRDFDRKTQVPRGTLTP